MATRTQKTKVGVFVLTTLVIIVTCVLVIAGYTREPHDSYWVEFDESIQGLTEGGTVVYMGVPVGTVGEIFVTDDLQARVRIDVNRDTVTLREGVRARLGLDSVAAGTMAVMLSGGDPEGDMLEPGAEIPADPSLIEAVSSQVEEILFDLSRIAGDVSDALEGLDEGELTDMIRDASGMLREARQVVNSVGETVYGLQDTAEESMKDFSRLANELGNLTEETTQLVVSTREQLDTLEVEETQQQVRRLFTHMEELSEKLIHATEVFSESAEGVVHQTDNMEYHLRDSLQTLNETLESIRRLSDYLQDDPSAVIRGRGQPEGR